MGRRQVTEAIHKLKPHDYTAIAHHYRHVKECFKDDMPVAPYRWSDFFSLTPFFTFRGKLVAKERPRVSGKRTYTPQRTRDFEASVAVAAASYMAMLEAKAVAFPIYVSLDLYDSPAKPADAMLGRAGLKHHTKNDADNIVKSVFDGCNGILWHDDKQIVGHTVSRAYSDKPGFLLAFRRAGLTENELTTLNGVYRGLYGEELN